MPNMDCLLQMVDTMGRVQLQRAKQGFHIMKALTAILSLISARRSMR